MEAITLVVIVTLRALVANCEMTTENYSFQTEAFNCKSICNGQFDIFYFREESICRCHISNDVDEIELENLRKKAKTLQIPVIYKRSTPNEFRKNHYKKRGVEENIIKPSFPQTTAQPKIFFPEVLKRKTVTKPEMVNVKHAELMLNAKLLLERAQERIKKLKERRQQQMLHTQQLSIIAPPSVILSTEVPASKHDVFKYKQNKKESQKRESNLLADIGSEIQKWGGHFVNNGEFAVTIDSGHIRPIDFVPNAVRPFVPPVSAVMGRPPLLASVPNKNDDSFEEKLKPDINQQGVLGPPPTEIFSIITNPSWIFREES